VTARRAFAVGCAAGVLLAAAWLAGLAAMDHHAVTTGQAIR
jgi:hypothetical protein